MKAILSDQRCQGVLLLVLMAVVFVLGAGERLDGSTESYNAGFYQGRFLRAYQRVGFGELGGRTVVGIIPTDSSPIVRPYYHHPPFYPWLLQACVQGSREIFRFRLPSILASLALGWSLWWFMRRTAGGVAAIGALSGLALSPMLLRYGDMVNPEPLTLLPLFLAVASWSLGRRRVALLWILCATMMDWQGGFAVPAIAVLSDARSWRQRVKELVLPSIVAVVGVMITVAIFVAWQGGFSAFDRLLSLGTQSTTEGASLAEWLLNQADYLFLGIGVSVVCSVAVVCIPSLASSSERRMVAAFFLPGALNVALFREHAFDHPFWWYLSLPGFCIGGGLLVARVVAFRRVSAVVALSALLVLQVGLVALDRGREQEPLSDQVARINESVGANDLFMRGDEFGPEVFYLNCWTWDAAKDPEQVREILRAHKRGELSVDVVHYALPDWVDRVCPGLRGTLDEFGPSVRLGKLRYYRFGTGG